MRKLSFALASAALVAFVLAAVSPAGAQQCPKGRNWDYASQSCK